MPLISFWVNAVYLSLYTAASTEPAVSGRPLVSLVLHDYYITAVPHLAFLGMRDHPDPDTGQANIILLLVELITQEKLVKRRRMNHLQK